MQSGSRFILALACVSFLAITLSGFHLHADIGGHEETVSHAHDLHPSPSHDLDGDHVDISIFEPARGFSQVEMFIPYFAVPELAALPPLENLCSADTPSLVPRRHLRWQPPLRAPPLFA
jgi:hypothetical protein